MVLVNYMVTPQRTEALAFKLSNILANAPPQLRPKIKPLRIYVDEIINLSKLIAQKPYFPAKRVGRLLSRMPPFPKGAPLKVALDHLIIEAIRVEKGAPSINLPTYVEQFNLVCAAELASQVSLLEKAAAATTNARLRSMIKRLVRQIWVAETELRNPALARNVAGKQSPLAATLLAAALGFTAIGALLFITQKFNEYAFLVFEGAVLGAIATYILIAKD